MKDLFYWVGGLLLLVAVILLADYFIGYRWFSFIEPKKENVRREIFLNTRSYNEGKKQDLIRMRMEYLQADESGKKVIANTIRHMFAEYNEDEKDLPVELKSFLKNIKYGELK